MSGWWSAPVRAQIDASIIDARPYLDPSRPDYGLQRAIDDAAAQSPATVLLPTGRFALETYLELRSGVTLRGQGTETILAAGRNETRVAITANQSANTSASVTIADTRGLQPEMTVYLWYNIRDKPEPFTIKAVVSSTRLTLDRVIPRSLTAGTAQLSYGLYTRLREPVNGKDTDVQTLRVAWPETFKVGEALTIVGSESQGGWWGVEVNHVTAIDMATGTLTLAKDIRVNAAAGAIVAHGYPLMWGAGFRSQGTNVVNAGVEDLVIEGWSTAVKPAFHDFVLGGLSFAECDGMRISRVTVRDWHSDGVSLQRCRDGMITDVTASRNRGHGFHPGSDSQRLEFVDVKALDNLGYGPAGTAGHGLYYCWGNTQVNIRGGIFRGNAAAGIGDLGGGNSNGSSPDHTNIIEGALIERNGRSGIEITGGGMQSNTTIRNNTIRDNGLSGSGYSGILLVPSKGNAGTYRISDNLIENTLTPATQAYGVREAAGKYVVDANTITTNRIRNHPLGNVVIIGPSTVSSGNSETDPTPTPVPSVRIWLPGIFQVEDYNSGGQQVGYSDTTAGNASGKYRTDDVDIQSCSDPTSTPCYNVGYIAAGEWLKYDVEVASTGDYAFTVRAATPNTGRRMRIEVDGVNVTGSITLPITGGYQEWGNVASGPVRLEAGPHQVRVFAETSGFNLNYVMLSQQ
jgi:hypothetical protein